MAKSKNPDGTKKDTAKVVTKKPAVVKVPGIKPNFTRRTQRFADDTQIHTARVDAAYEEASKVYSDFDFGVLGTYGFATPEGKVVVDVVNNGGDKPAIYVLESTVPTVDTDDHWFLVHTCLRHTEVRQIAGDLLFKWQKAVHAFLRPFMLDLPKAGTVTTAVKTSEPARNLTAEDIAAITHAQKRREKKQADRKLREIAQQKMQTALHHMLKSTITVTQAATGGIGYCDLSDASGKLIALFGQDGNDATVSVAFMAEGHVLRLAGVAVDDKVFAGYLKYGKVDDDHRMKMTPQAYAKREALTKYLRSQLEARGIKFKFGIASNMSNLLQVA